MNTEIRELSFAELDQVSGAADPNYGECVYGAKGGGGPGMYPVGTDCSPGWGDLVQIIVDTANKGRAIQQKFGSGRPQ